MHLITGVFDHCCAFDRVQCTLAGAFDRICAIHRAVAFDCTGGLVKLARMITLAYFIVRDHCSALDQWRVG